MSSKKIYLTYDDLFARVKTLPLALDPGTRIYGVPNGGTHAAMMVNIKYPILRLVDCPGNADFFVDDVIDSGATRDRYAKEYPNTPFYALVDKTKQDKDWQGSWIVFPWEAAQQISGPEDNVSRLLQYIGEDINREGLKETPTRVIKAYDELFAGYKQDPKDVFKCFEDGACDEMVLLKGIEVQSYCEHHLLPFFGEAHIAYIPNGKIIGVSKLARLLDIFAHRLQVQERLTTQVTTALDAYLEPLGSACVIKASHMCMVCRGVKKQHSELVTSSLTGAFREEPATRAEFFNLIGGGG